MSTATYMIECFVSHTMVDTAYCRQLVLPAIEAVAPPCINQYWFMNLKNFGRSSADDWESAELFAAGYAKEIERLLRDSRFFILVASAAATTSEWVRYEVAWWIENRSMQEALVIQASASDVSRLHPKAEMWSSIRPGDPTSVDSGLQLRQALQDMYSYSKS